MDMNPERWNVLFQKYRLNDSSSSGISGSDDPSQTLLNLSSPDFIFLVKDLLDLRDDKNTSLEEAGAVARRLIAMFCWKREEGARVHKVRAEEFIQVSNQYKECCRFPCMLISEMHSSLK